MAGHDRTGIDRRRALGLGASIIFLPALPGGDWPRRTAAGRRMTGADLAGWRIDVGDGVYAAPGESPVDSADIRTLHHGDRSELQANIRRRGVMAHNITYHRIDDTSAFDHVHTASFRFRLPDDPRLRSADRAGQTFEGGLAIWDGSGSRLDHQVLFQWIVNPHWPDMYGVVQTAVRVGDRAGWVPVGRIEPDDAWHEAHIVLDARRGTSLVAIDGVRFASALHAVPKPANWGPETAARLQVEIISLYAEDGSLRPLHRAEVADWSWVWDGADCPEPVPPPPQPTPIPARPLADREIGRWTWRAHGQVDGPPAPPPAAADELIVFHGDLRESGGFHWHIAGPGRPTCRPKATAVAQLVVGGTEAARRERAEAIAAGAAASARVADWPSRETALWC